ncbi:MAG: tyrosine-type recombinase/integrase [Verrucomicrobiia bacterium]|jgi:integrase
MNDWVLTPDRFLTKNEMVALLGNAEECRARGVERHQRQPVKDWILVRVAILAGLRASELADLRVVDCFVGYGRSEIVVRHGKNGKSRVVKISPDLKRDIRWYLKWKSDQGELHPEAHLIKGHRKERVSRVALWKRWKKMCPQHRLHDARHSNATMLYEATTDLRFVQRQLGHSSPSITAVYADVTDSKARDGLAAMDKLVRHAVAEAGRCLVDANLPSSPGRVTEAAVQ